MECVGQDDCDYTDHLRKKYDAHRGDVCWNDKWYKYRYPRSFVMRPQSGTVVSSTLEQINPPELTFRDCDVVHNYWLTTTGLAHGRKILDRHFQYPILTKAPTLTRMNYMFPHVKNRMKKTLRGFNYDPAPFGVTTTKADYGPVRPIADFDYTNGYLVNIPAPRVIRVSKRGKPGFYNDEMFCILRKFNPYMTVTKIDYCDPTKEKQKYESPCC